MIEPTDEMTAAAFEARKHVSISTPESRMRASILAVLAIVERDYELRRMARCGDTTICPCHPCDVEPGHPGSHRNRLGLVWP